MITKEQLETYVKNSSIKELLSIPKESTIKFELLGHGEYNLNYSFIHPITKQKLVFRLNMGSQMHLSNQIEYEAQALKLLEASEHTPKVYYVDGSKKILPYGILVMEFLEGRALHYENDLRAAAECLAHIHSLKIADKQLLIQPKNPLKAMYEECVQMSSVYFNWERADKDVISITQRLLKKAEKLIPMDAIPGNHVINTELNSSNFIINDKLKKNYLIDWEKPLLGEVEQDLGHFLAPTTTFWKTDTILSRDKMYEFINIYIDSVNGRFPTDSIIEKTLCYIVMTCLRGITWCSMAYVEYESPNRTLKDEFTYKKLQKYLDINFLNDIEKEYFDINK
jgi:aminoglycoside phosphotransferase (APT) family kinase protein